MIDCKARFYVLILSFLSFGAFAHPHSFITLQAEIIAENDQVSGLNVSWNFDEFTSADILIEQDNEEAYQQLTDDIMKSIVKQSYLTEVIADDEKVLLDYSSDNYTATIDNYRFIINFTIKFQQALSPKKMTFSTFDPGYWVDMRYDGKEDVKIAKALQEKCSVAIKEPTVSDQQKAFASAFDISDTSTKQLNIGKIFAQEVDLLC